MGRITEYYRAASVEDAFAKAKQLGSVAAYVGGGVELVLRRNPEVTTLIDLSRCGLRLHCTNRGGDRDRFADHAHDNQPQRGHQAICRRFAGLVDRTYRAQQPAQDMITVGGAIGRNQPWNDVAATSRRPGRTGAAV